MDLNEAQLLFSLFFAIYFGLIIDRSHGMYQPFDTYNAWMGVPHNLNRLIAAWIILYLLPIIQFGVLFTLLGNFNVSFGPDIFGVINIVLVSVGSFFSFGYFRIFEAIIHSFPERFFTKEEQSIPSFTLRPYFYAHFIPGLLYVVVSTLLLGLTLYL